MMASRGEAEARARAVLLGNVGAAGLRAAGWVAEARVLNYDAVFARDVAIAAPGLWASGDAVLRAAAGESLASLAEAQAGSGQIPKFVKRGVGDFWYVSCPDATAWWWVAVMLGEVMAPGEGIAARHGRAAEAAQRWLLAQCHPQFGLVHQTEGGDWADMYPRSGFALYTNAVWAWGRWLAGDLAGYRQTVQHARWLFRPHEGDDPSDRRLAVLRARARGEAEASALCLGHVDLGSFGIEGDVFGNVLAALVGLVDRATADGIADAIIAGGLDRPYPLRVTVHVIGEEDGRWRSYMSTLR